MWAVMCRHARNDRAVSVGQHSCSTASARFVCFLCSPHHHSLLLPSSFPEHKRKTHQSLAAAAPAPGASTASAALARSAASEEQRTADGEYLYQGSWDCLRYVVTHLGWTQLYRGLKSAIVGMVWGWRAALLSAVLPSCFIFLFGGDRACPALCTSIGISGFAICCWSAAANVPSDRQRTCSSPA